MVASRHEGNMIYYYLTLDDTIARLERLASALRRQTEEYETGESQDSWEADPRFGVMNVKVLQENAYVI